MKKNIFLLLSLLLLFSNSLTFASVSNSNDKEAGYISLNSSLEKEVEPNVASINFSVETTGSTATVASNENKTLSNAIVLALKNNLTSETDEIKTTNFNVRPVYSTSVSGKRTIKNYIAVNSVNVKTRDIQKVSTLIDSAIKAGANKVDGLYYSFDEEKKVCQEIYPVLVSDLKTQASILAKAAGTTLDGLKHLNASCNASSPVANTRLYAKASGYSQETDNASSPTPIEVGKVKIRVYVNADFYVK